MCPFNFETVRKAEKVCVWAATITSRFLSLTKKVPNNAQQLAYKLALCFCNHVMSRGIGGGGGGGGGVGGEASLAHIKQIR